MFTYSLCDDKKNNKATISRPKAPYQNKGNAVFET